MKGNNTPFFFVLTITISFRLKLVESSFITSLETYESSIRHNLLALSLFPGSFDGISAAALFGCGYEHAQDSLGVLLEYSLLVL